MTTATKTRKPADAKAEPKPTTNYGPFNIYTGDVSSPTLAYYVLGLLCEHQYGYSITELTSAYRDVINQYLPEGVTLVDDELIGPHPYDIELHQPIVDAFERAEGRLPELCEKYAVAAARVAA